MDLLKTKIYENILYIISTIVLGITSFFLLKKVIILIFFLVVCLFFVFTVSNDFGYSNFKRWQKNER